MPTTVSGGSLAASTTYFYTITATNAGGQTMPSNEQQATTSAVNQTISLSWAPVVGATAYNVYRGTVAGGEDRLIAANVVLTSYNDAAASIVAPLLNNPPTYSPGASGLTNGANALLRGDSRQVHRRDHRLQRGYSTFSGGMDIVTLSWGAVAGATGYNVYRGTVPGGRTAWCRHSSATPAPRSTTPEAPAPHCASNNAPVAGGSLTIGTTYYYKVIATDATGTTLDSNEVSAALTTAGLQTIPLSWTAVAGATYTMYRGTSSGGENVVVASNLAGTTYRDGRRSPHRARAQRPNNRGRRRAYRRHDLLLRAGGDQRPWRDDGFQGGLRHGPRTEPRGFALLGDRPRGDRLQAVSRHLAGAETVLVKVLGPVNGYVDVGAAVTSEIPPATNSERTMRTASTPVRTPA